MPRRNQSTARMFVEARDRRVAAMTLAGLSASFIARKLDLSQRTVVRIRARLRVSGGLK